MSAAESAATEAFVEVAVIAPLRQTFDYVLPSGMNRPAELRGCRVRVPFGRGTRVGVILEERATSAVARTKLKRVLEVLDAEPLLQRADLELAAWAASYYHHAPGEVIAAMLPVRLRRSASLPNDKCEAWRLTPLGEANAGSSHPGAARQSELMEQLAAGTCTPATFAGLGFGWRPVLRRLIARGWVESCPPPDAVAAPFSAPACIVLNAEQERAAELVGAALGGFSTIVLEGVTGSGKTEVYLHVIEQCLDAGGQALVLVPEIGLTQHLVERFSARFGPRVGVLHSGLSDRERALTWRRGAGGEAMVVIGTRSAVWAPLPGLRLIVVDEEHDQSYKQQDGFRYSARDVAIVRAQSAALPVVLGSATPSLETLANVERGKYSLSRIESRPDDVPMPDVACLDVRGVPLNAGLSDALLEAMREHLAAGGQVMLFLNRRGYSPLLICRSCGEPRRCDRCDAYLVYHKAAGTARCHHCDRQWYLNRPAGCCEEPEIAQIGLGTERVEETVREIFPDHSVCRVDRDAVRRQGYFDEVLTAVAERRVDIVIGTQMVAKGFDFAGVTLVGVVDADSRLYSVDFRAEERLAQLLVQVSGRAGRATVRGRVLVQTHHPHHPVLRRIIEHGYGAYAQTALAERQEAALPPFAAMAVLRADSAKATAALGFLARARTLLSEDAPKRLDISYPIPALMERRAGRYRALLVLRAPGRAGIARVLSQRLSALEELARSERVRLSVDVDPQDTL